MKVAYTTGLRELGDGLSSAPDGLLGRHAVGTGHCWRLRVESPTITDAKVPGTTHAQRIPFHPSHTTLRDVAYACVRPTAGAASVVVRGDCPHETSSA